MPAVNFPTSESEHGHTSIELSLNSVVMTGIQRIAYGDSLEWSEVGDTRGFVIAHVRGMYKSKDLEVEILTSHWEAFVAAQPDETWRVNPFRTLVHRRTPGLAVYTDTIVGCRFKDLDTESSHGSADGHTVKKTFVTRGVLWRGKLPIRGFRP